MKVLVIIPAFNEQDNIEKVLSQLSACKIDAVKLDYLVINDCSTDDTKRVLKEYGANYLDLPINLGIGGAVQSGYIYALNHGYDIAVQMDGDGQHRADNLAPLLKPVLDGNADVAIGSRFIDKEGFQSSFMRRTGINFLSGLIRLVCGVQVKDATSGFRAVNRKIIALLSHDYAQDYPEPEAIVTCAGHGARITEVPVIMNERTGGKSSISGFKSVYYMIKVSIAIIIARISIRREDI